MKSSYYLPWAQISSILIGDRQLRQAVPWGMGILGVVGVHFIHARVLMISSLSGRGILSDTWREEHVNLANAARPWATLPDRRSVQFPNTRRYRVTCNEKETPQTRHAQRCKSSCENSRVSMAVGRRWSWWQLPTNPTQAFPRPPGPTPGQQASGRSGLSPEQQKKKKKKS
jgi:hypothetical protein